MVFNRALKADIKRILTIFALGTMAVAFMVAFLFNAVFARTGIDIPVEIIWSDQNSSSRPSSVTLQLMDGSTVVSSITLTSANQDPNDSDKWVGSFDSVAYGTNYTIVEGNVSGYTITTNNVAVTYSSTSTTLVDYSSNVSSGTGVINLGDVNIIFGKRTNSGGGSQKYYIWTLEEYTGTKYTELLTALRAIDSNLPTNSRNIGYFYGLPVTITGQQSGSSGYATVSGSEGAITFQRNNSSNFPSNLMRSGNVTPAIANTVSITNTKDTTAGYDVIYQFTGSVLPPSVSSLLPATATYQAGDTVTVAADPAASGYRFLGWSQTGTFTMPAADVTITGSWEQFNGYFTPTISIAVEDEKSYYRITDTATFAITVTNTASFPITNVVVDELLNGAEFTSGTGYSLVSAEQASIPSLAAGASVTLYATYQIPPLDVTQSITNTVEISSATASNYYFLDPDQDYTATASFNVRSWQDDPVQSGVTYDSTTFYLFLMLTGAIGIGGSVVVHRTNKIKERKR